MKKLLSFFLAFLMLVTSVCFFNVEAYTNHTRDEAVSWACNKGDTQWAVDVDNYAGCQCVDLILAYYDYLLGWHASGNAIDYSWNDLPEGWSRVYSNPQAGDIVVWKAGGNVGAGTYYNEYAHSSFGHIGIVWRVNSSGTLSTIETNTLGGVNAGYRERGTRDVACYIRPDFNNTHSLDVNIVVDGTDYGSGHPDFTFDVRINGKIAFNDVKDYFSDVAHGAEWAIIDIKHPSEYVLTGSMDSYGNFAGVLNSDTVVKPIFTKPILKATKTFNNSKYEFYSVNTRWDSANQFATAKGGHLLTINSAEENEFIKNNNTIGNLWLGATRSNDTFKWVTGENFSYTNWDANQPDNSKGVCADGEKFLGLFSSGKWNDYPWYSSSINGFIVEYDLHTHSYSSKITRDATCTSTGIRTFTCSCGDSYTESIPKTAHSFTSKTVAPTYLKSSATCTSPAVYYYKCADCDEKGTETFTSGSALGHTESAWIIDKEATAAAAGSKHIECTVCHTTIRTATIPKITTTDSKLVIESKKAKAGDEIEVSVSLEKNPGIAGLQISLNYDTSVLTLKNSKNGTLFSGFTAGKNFVWDDSSNITADGKIATFTFTVADNAAAGEYEISAIVRSCTNEAFDDVELAVESGVVTVVDFTYGDANDDDAINMKDVVILRQYLANYDYETNTSTVTIGAGADANGDGAINMKDVVILRQYLANYDYETNTSTVVLGPQ